MHRSMTGLVSMALGMFALPAHALLIQTDSNGLAAVSLGQADVGSSFQIDWHIPAGTAGDGGTTPVDLTASSTWTLDSFTSSQLVFGVSLTNTTTLAAGSDKENVLSIGFDITPAASSAAVTGAGVFDSASVGQTFPSFKTIGVCVWAAQNCAGGNVNQGLVAGATDTFTLTLGGTFDQDVELSRFAIKFQGDYGSYQAGATTTEVPEPMTLLLLGAGLLGFTLFRHRRQQRTGVAA